MLAGYFKESEHVLMPTIRTVRTMAAVLAAAVSMLGFCSFGPLNPTALAAQGAEAAIVDSGYTRHYASLNAWDYQSEFVDITWLISTLARAGISAAVITDHDLEMGALESYKALVLPSTSCVSQLAAERIVEFAEAGGRVFATFDTSLHDDFWRVRPDYELTRIMGVRHSSMKEVDTNAMSPSAKSHPIFRGLDSPIPVPRQRGLANRVNPDALVLAKWPDGRLAMTETRYGIYCSENLFSAENAAVPEAAALIANTIGYLVNVKHGAGFNLGQLKTKAAWYTPPTDRDRIAHDLQRLSAAGFNTVFVSAYSHGRALYPSQTVAQDPAFSAVDGFDPLQAALEEGKQAGLSVHAWVDAFDAGQAASDGTLPPLLLEHPDWAAMARDDRTPAAAAASQGGRCFLSPAHPEVQEFIMDVVRELVTSYALDGVHLDSVCYPEGKDAPYDFNPRVLELAAADLGFAPRSIGLNIARWNGWFDWRCRNLDAFVGGLVSMIREVSPGTLISASVYPYPDSVLLRMQDWSKWTAPGWLDFVVPLTDTRSADLVDTLVRAAQDFAGVNTPVVAGISAASIPAKSVAPTLANLVDAARAAGAYGVSVYDSRPLSDNALSALLDGPFRAPSE